MGLQLHYDHFPQCPTHAITGPGPEMWDPFCCFQLDKCDPQISKDFCSAKYSRGCVTAQIKGNQQRQKELGKRNKIVIGIYKIRRKFYITKILLYFIGKNESTISIINILIISIRLQYFRKKDNQLMTAWFPYNPLYFI